MPNYLLIAHLLGATIWTGGHLILSLVVLPKALLKHDIDVLLQFEAQFEKVGMSARFYVIPKLSPQTLKAFSVNIILVTLLSVSFVIVGSLFRTGL